MSPPSTPTSSPAQTTRRLTMLAVVVVVVSLLGGGAFWLWREAEVAGLRAAADEGVARPVGALRLVSGMEEVSEQPATTPPASSAVVPDAKLRVQIEMELRQMTLPVDGVDIEVRQQRVTLRGEVDSALTRDAIEVVVRAVKGVLQLDNRLQITKTERAQ